jgi:hypothetical protein
VSARGQPPEQGQEAEPETQRGRKPKAEGQEAQSACHEWPGQFTGRSGGCFFRIDDQNEPRTAFGVHAPSVSFALCNQALSDNLAEHGAGGGVSASASYKANSAGVKLGAHAFAELENPPGQFLTQTVKINGDDAPLNGRVKSHLPRLFRVLSRPLELAGWRFNFLEQVPNAVDVSWNGGCHHCF